MRILLQLFSWGRCQCETSPKMETKYLLCTVYISYHDNSDHMELCSCCLVGCFPVYGAGSYDFLFQLLVQWTCEANFCQIRSKPLINGKGLCSESRSLGPWHHLCCWIIGWLLCLMFCWRFLLWSMIKWIKISHSDVLQKLTIGRWYGCCLYKMISWHIMSAFVKVTSNPQNQSAHHHFSFCWNVA